MNHFLMVGAGSLLYVDDGIFKRMRIQPYMYLFLYSPDCHGEIGKELHSLSYSLFQFCKRLYSTGFKYIENINATAPQPQRTVLKYFAIFKKFAHNLEPGETPSNSASHRAPNYLQSY